ncbi:DNA glycosylase [Dendrothele bispora CBS 962.96]|uniref:DNA glycosylase n=1 Tax=Dendrothele bispora (strain CBS 962.96) TaxID=1314807 RepID=A0A4S8M966_DENBC|nr:DNA glycosylase [Dendrothele bispora CBS 962.96]
MTNSLLGKRVRKPLAEAEEEDLDSGRVQFEEEKVEEEEDDQTASESVVVQGFRASLSRFTYSASASASASPSPTKTRKSKPNANVEVGGSPFTSTPKRGRPSSSSRLLQRSDSEEDSGGASPSVKKKQKKKSRGYASPETDWILCFAGLSQRSAELGHHFAHPTNHFWKCLHLSGLTTSQLSPTEDYTLPERFSYGLTNIVDRPTAEASELKDSELTAGVPTFLKKIDKYRPRIVCFVGLNIGRSVLKYAMKNSQPRPQGPGKALKKGEGQSKVFAPGLQMIHKRSGAQDGEITETFFYAVPSTSGKVQGYQIPDKTLLFKQLKEHMENIKDGTFSPSFQFSELTI